MKYWTYAEIKNKIRIDLGIQQETFVTEAEMLGYVNAAIDEAEAEIHTLYEDYFLTRDAQSLVSGTSTYDLPDNIYAHKVRSIIYKQDSDIYSIRRFKVRDDMFVGLEVADELSTTDYQYILRNDSASLGTKIHLIPTPDANVTDGLILWYLRNANRMEDDTSICDIPEFVHFVIQYAKVRCYEKEGHPNLELALGILEHFRKNMISTLTDMTPDGDNIIEQDLTFYREMEGY